MCDNFQSFRTVAIWFFRQCLFLCLQITKCQAHPPKWGSSGYLIAHNNGVALGVPGTIGYRCIMGHMYSNITCVLFSQWPWYRWKFINGMGLSVIYDTYSFDMLLTMSDLCHLQEKITESNTVSIKIWTMNSMALHRWVLIMPITCVQQKMF